MWSELCELAGTVGPNVMDGLTMPLDKIHQMPEHVTRTVAR